MLCAPDGVTVPLTRDDNPSVETAQQALVAFLRDEVGPALRRLGLRGSGTAYLLPDDRFWLVVGFQRSTSSNHEALRFTVNLTAASRARWDAARRSNPWIGARPSGNSGYAVRGLVEFVRIGSLLPVPQDTWWEIRPGRSTGVLIDELMAVIATTGLPWLRSHGASDLIE